MKLLFPSVLCLLFAACETVLPAPKPGTAEHQRWLHEQAREHFLALKAQERERRGYPAQPHVADRRENVQPLVKPAPTPRPRSWLFAQSKPAKPAKPARTTRRAMDDTIYEPTAEGRAEQREWELREAREYLAFEAQEAKRLGKTPAQLTRAERAWIRARAE